VIALAVVGPIASGKSTVLAILGRLGAVVCSADDIAREITRPGQPALARIFGEFGEDFRRDDGSLDRGAMARRIFRDAAARERLEAILHPIILDRIAAWLDAQRRQSDPPSVAAVEVLRLPRALGARQHFDVVWLCAASPEIRAGRLTARDGLPKAEALRRIRVQEGQAVEDCRPDLVLDTGTTRRQLEARVESAFAALASGVAR
jgi:dephospho-CoA kinase